MSERKPERYNTKFLVSQIETDQKRKRMIALAVIGVLVLVAVWFLVIHPPVPPINAESTPSMIAPPTVAPPTVAPPTAVPPPAVPSPATPPTAAPPQPRAPAPRRH